jgi:hypothetical protein
MTVSQHMWIQPSDLGSQWEDSEYAEDAIQLASQMLWAMSGRKYSGTATVTERYVRFSPLINTRLLQEAAVLNSRVNKALQIVEPWVSAETRIRLRGQPVTQIHTVRNVGSGVIVSPDSYYIVDHSTLQFSEGALIVPADIEISYSYGVLPPIAGRMAARRLALEYIKLWSGSDDCALPERVTSVNRQGVSYTIIDSQEFIDEMRTGIYEVDLFLKAINPDKARKRSKVFSPDMPKARRYTRKSSVYVSSPRDIVVHKATTGTVTISLASVNAEYLASESGWTLQFIIRSWASSHTKTMDATSVHLTSTDITLSVPYSDAFGVLGMVDPGTWDLYATKNGTTAQVVSGNLAINIVQ